MKYGIKSMTQHELSERLGVSKKELFLKFGNKEQLLTDCIAFMHQTVEGLLDDQITDNMTPLQKIATTYHITVDYLSQFNSTFYFDLKKNGTVFNIVQNYITDHKNNRVYPIIEQARTAKLLNDEVETSEAGDFYIKVISQFFMNYKSDQEAIENHLGLFLKRYFNPAS